jgi:predicted nucleotidyltransferase
LPALRAHEAELKRLGVEHLYLFGSMAREEARAHSDVDLFFDHQEGSLGLFDLMAVKETASRILGRQADVMTRRGLHPVLRSEIEASARWADNVERRLIAVTDFADEPGLADHALDEPEPIGQVKLVHIIMLAGQVLHEDGHFPAPAIEGVGHSQVSSQ